MTIIRRDPPNSQPNVVRSRPVVHPTPNSVPPSRPYDEPVQIEYVVKDGGAFGPPGPAGRDGVDGAPGQPGADGGGLRFVERQFTSPTTDWFWEHNLGTRAIEVNCYEPDGITEKEAVPDLLDENTVQIQWYYPEAGILRLLY